MARQRSLHHRTFLIYIVIGGILLFLFRGTVQKFIVNPFQSIVYQTSRSLTSLKFNTVNFFRLTEGLSSEESEKLQHAYEQLLIENTKLSESVRDCKALEPFLHYKEREGEQVVIAHVIAETATFEHSFSVDRGSEDGVTVGDPVVTADGVILGKVSVVRKKSASVLRLSDSKSVLAVAGEESETIGILYGDRGTAMVVRFIAQDANLKKGDTIISSGLEGGVRRGYVVGVVDVITGDEQTPFHSATVEAPVSARFPRFVHIIRAITE